MFEVLRSNHEKYTVWKCRGD